MDVCTESAHRLRYPWGTAESSCTLLLNCGTDDDPEWFTCCELHKIRSRMAAPDRYAVKSEWALRPRLMRALEAVDEWQHARLPKPGRGFHAWYWFWRPLCNLRESMYLRKS